MDYPNKVLEGCFEPAIPKNEVLAAAKRILCGDVRAILPLPLIETFDRSLQVFRLPLNGSNMGACNNLLLRHDCNCTINVNVQLIAQLMYMYINWALRTCRTEAGAFRKRNTFHKTGRRFCVCVSWKILPYRRTPR